MFDTAIPQERNLAIRLARIAISVDRAWVGGLDGFPQPFFEAEIELLQFLIHCGNN